MTAPPPPELPIDEQISQFQEYMVFAHDSASTAFLNGTVFYNVKTEIKQDTIRFGFTVKQGKPVQLYKPNEDWDTTTFHNTPIEIHMEERVYRDVFSGIGKSELCNAIWSGKIYVGPWEIKSVYNFGCSFKFDQWPEFYKMKRRQAAQKLELKRRQTVAAAVAAAVAAEE